MRDNAGPSIDTKVPRPMTIVPDSQSEWLVRKKIMESIHIGTAVNPQAVRRLRSAPWASQIAACDASVKAALARAAAGS